MPPCIIKPDVCQAKDYENNRRVHHNPAPGVYDGQACVTCAWCGKILEEPRG